MKLRVLQSFSLVFLIAFAFFFLAPNIVLADAKSECEDTPHPIFEQYQIDNGEADAWCFSLGEYCLWLGDDIYGYCVYEKPASIPVEETPAKKSCENIDLSGEEKDKRGICEKNNCDYDTSSNKCKTKSTSTTTETKTTNKDVDITFPNPLAGNASNAHEISIATTTLIAKVISAILGLLGSVSLLVFLIGGVLYLVSGGEEAKVKKSVDTLKWAFLGLVVVFAAYAILNMALYGLSFITGS